MRYWPVAARLWLVFAFVAVAHPEVGWSAELVPTSATPSLSASGGSYDPQFTADGHWIVFLSDAANLVTNSVPGGYPNVFVQEKTTSRVSLVSATPLARGGNGSSTSPSVSSNGQFVVFASAASDLVPNDTNGFRDIFLRDLLSGTTVLISSAPGGGAANGDSSTPRISPDGRFILFESSAENLVPGDANRLSDLFLYDRMIGVTTLASVGAEGLPGSAHGSLVKSEMAGMTPDGHWVVFASAASNLVSGATGGTREIYLRDRQASTTIWVSFNATNFLPAPVACSNPLLSDDGRYAVFKASSRSSNVTVLFCHDLQTATTRLLSPDADPYSWPGMSSDGSWVVSELHSNVFLWNTSAGTNLMINRPLDPGTRCLAPVLSPDASRVAFLSSSPSMSTNGAPGFQLYIRDLSSGETRLASVNSLRKATGDLSTITPSFDPSGSLVAFESPEPGMVPDDNNLASDIFVYDWPNDGVELVSRRVLNRPSRALQGLSVSGPAGVSANGRYVAFSTTDTNIYLTGRTNGFNFGVWDTWQNTNVVLRILTNAPPPDGGTLPPGTNYIATKSLGLGPVLSPDGSVLVYTTIRSDSTQTGDRGDVFAMDLATAGTSWVNPNSQSPTFGSAVTSGPSISADNQVVAFQSGLYDIPADVPQANDSSMDVFTYNTRLHTNTLVSVNRSRTGAGNGASFKPLVSPDGRWVLFQSTATNLTSPSYTFPANRAQEFVRDLKGSNTLLLSFGVDGLPLSGTPTSQVFSLDSKVVAFGGKFVLGTNGIPVAAIYVYDLFTRTNCLVCTNCQEPSLDATGRWIVYTKSQDGTGIPNVFGTDLHAGQELLLSVDTAGNRGGNAASWSPLITSDARYVVFVSKASNLVLNDKNGLPDVFVRDRVFAKTFCLSMNALGTSSGDAASGRLAVSADGRTVVFQSLARDLATGDFNEQRDVFIARLGGPDSDHDGMDDDWEAAYFGTLNRDGYGDFDGDGVRDLEEFRAGTDPTNQGSVLRVISISSPSSDVVNLVWASVPGRSYQVQFKDDLNEAGWSFLPGIVVATSTTAVSQDSQPSPHRFYRVVIAN